MLIYSGEFQFIHELAIICYYKFFEIAKSFATKNEEYKMNVIQQHKINDRYLIIQLLLQISKKYFTFQRNFPAIRGDFL